LSTARLLRSKLAKRRIWKRVLAERLAEPLHLNLLSIFVLALGSYRSKVAWDLVVRQHYAFGALEAADIAKACGLSAVTLLEVGVASGAGLMNLALIADQVSKETGIRCEVHGFDSGTGMPAPVDYRDHPDLYAPGDFAMDAEALRSVLPRSCDLHLGPLRSTIPRFLERVRPAAPIGFVALDVDYWSSTADALELFKDCPEKYLPRTVVYVDDIALPDHNSGAGAALAIAEFNRVMPRRRLESHPFLENNRIFRRPAWIKQTMFLHVLDHPWRSEPARAPTKRYIENPYLATPQPEECFHPDTPPAR
jgi:hypothetical protein